MPESVGKLSLIDSRHGDLSEEEQKMLEEYRADRELYIELYDQAYPCPLLGGDNVQRLQAENSEDIVSRLAVLKEKWLPISIEPAQGEEEEQVFIDIPQGEGYVME